MNASFWSVLRKAFVKPAPWQLPPQAAIGRTDRRPRRPPLGCERLEDRTLLSGETLAAAIPIAFGPTGGADLTAHLATARDVELTRLTLAAGDTVTAAVSTQRYSGGLDGYLRVFDAQGKQIASDDNFTGLDPQLTFQAPAGGVYYVGVSSAGNTAYDPQVVQNGVGSSFGFFDLNFRKTNAPLLPDLVGASFALAAGTAVWGDAVQVHYRIENHGGAAAGPFTVELRLSADNRLDAGDSLLQTFTVNNLDAGQAATGTLTVTLPGSPGSPPPGFTESEQVFLGLRLDPANTVTESNKVNNSSSPEQGNDWAPLSVLTPVTATGIHDAFATAAAVPLDSRAAGVLGAADEVNVYRVALTESGRLTAQVHANGLATRLSLYDASGKLLIQSDGQSPDNPDDRIVQYLDGSVSGSMYFLKVEGLRGGAGAYTLTTQFTPGASPGQPIPLKENTPNLITGDFNGDGVLDLAAANGNGVTVLLGNGDGAFRDGGTFGTGFFGQIVAGDFNGDGVIDLAAEDSYPYASVAVLLGNGDGTFRDGGTFGTGFFGYGLAVGDFNGDGRLDLVAAVAGGMVGSPVVVLLGNGDGSFRTGGTFGTNVVGQVVAGDFNGDARLDLIDTNESGGVAVLLGNGDGSFRTGGTFGTDVVGQIVVGGDFNGDGVLDLAAESSLLDPGGVRDTGVTALLGNGDSSFRTRTGGTIGNLAGSVAGDFNGDGVLDLAIAAKPFFGPGGVTVLLGNGDGTFRDGGTFGTGLFGSGLAVGDFNGDGVLDLAADDGDGGVTVLLGDGHGSFRTGGNYGTLRVGFAGSLVAGDFNGDGVLDLAADSVLIGLPGMQPGVTVLLGNGDGSFRTGVSFGTGDFGPMVAGDFNGDGVFDLVVDGSLLLGTGDGHFYPAAQSSHPIQTPPLFADLTGDGVPDLFALRQDGGILFRRGQAGQPGVFDAPVVLNPSGGGEGGPARDLTVVSSGGRNILAALDDTGSLSFYSFDPATGVFTHTLGPKVPGLFPVRIAAGDLNGDGRDDLVVVAAGSDQVFVYLQDSSGGFGPKPSYMASVGVDPSGVQLVDMDGDRRLDIVVTNQFSGDISVLLNDPAHPFSTEQRFRARTGPFGLGSLISTAASPGVQSQEGTFAVVAGAFGGGPNPPNSDVVVINSKTNTASVLIGDGAGGLLNPEPDRTFYTGVSPTSAVAGGFDLRTPNPGLAVLDPLSHTILLFSGDGVGHFTLASSVDAGNSPTGLSVADVNQDGILDLLVSNRFGDVLVLLGNGDGTFQPYNRIDRHVSLTTTDGQHFYFSNKSQDQVAVANGVGNPASTVFQDRGNGILAPGAITTVTVGGTPYLLVANSGGNDLLMYRGDGSGLFDPASVQTFFAGADPVGITVADVNGDNVPDVLVANQGSNDVSVFLGQGSGASYTLTAGPRLKAGAGPVSTALSTVNGATYLAVANSQSNDVWLLPSRGAGFFSDQTADVVKVPVGKDPVTIIQGNFNGQPGLVTVNAGSNSLTEISNFVGATPQIFTIATGPHPVAAVAGDFFHNGFFGLIVASGGSDSVSLYLGGQNGLGAAAEDTQFLPNGLPPLTDLVFAPGESGGDFVGVDVAVEGEDIAIPLLLKRAAASDNGGSQKRRDDASGNEESQKNGIEIILELEPFTSMTVSIVPTYVPGGPSI